VATEHAPTTEPAIQPSSRIDLHTHSNHSDGLQAPAALVAEASRRGLSVLGLTDHDTVAGIPEAASAAGAAGIDLIPGVELSAGGPDHEIHILGYFVDPTDQAFIAALARLAARRVDRAERIVERLGAIGVPVTLARVRDLAGTGSIGRPHVARAMIEAGHVADVAEAFDRFLGSGRPGFVPRARFTPTEAVGLLLANRAVPVFAHPLTSGDIEATLRLLVPLGLRGMEVYYGEYDPETRDRLRAIADRWELVPTGGSDYHGPGFKPGRELGAPIVPMECVTRLRLAHARLGAETNHDRR